MKKRSQRGAARISAVWMIVSIVLMFVALAFGWISNQDKAQAEEVAVAATSSAADSEAKYDTELLVSREISQVLGYFPKEEIGGRSNVEAATAGLGELKAAFPDLDDSVTTFAEAVQPIVSAYAARQTEIANLTSAKNDLQSQIDALRTSTTTLTTEKDDQIRTLQSQLTDAENASKTLQADLETRLAEATDSRNQLDSDLRDARGMIEDTKRTAEQEKGALKSRINSLATKTAFINEEPEKPDAQILAVSQDLGIGWIDIGARKRLNRGARFRVVSGGTEARLKGWCEVTSVDTERAEVRFFDLVDPFNPPVRADFVYNPLYDPDGQRNAILVGNFNGAYNASDLKVLLSDIGITVTKKLDNDTDFMIVGSELFVDADGETLEDPLQPSDLPIYKDAQAKGVQPISVGDVTQYFRR